MILTDWPIISKSSMNKRWEIYLPRGEFDDFAKFMEEEGFGQVKVSFVGSSAWILSYPSEEIKMIAKLRYHVTEIVDKYGISVNFTDCPKPE